MTDPDRIRIDTALTTAARALLTLTRHQLTSMSGTLEGCAQVHDFDPAVTAAFTAINNVVTAITTYGADKATTHQRETGHAEPLRF